MTEDDSRTVVVNEIVKHMVNVQIMHLDMKSATLQDLLDSERRQIPTAKAIEKTLQSSSVYRRSLNQTLSIYKKIINGFSEHKSLLSGTFRWGSRARSKSNFLSQISL